MSVLVKGLLVFCGMFLLVAVVRLFENEITAKSDTTQYVVTRKAENAVSDKPDTGMALKNMPIYITELDEYSAYLAVLNKINTGVVFVDTPPYVIELELYKAYSAVVETAYNDAFNEDNPRVWRALLRKQYADSDALRKKIATAFGATSCEIYSEKIRLYFKDGSAKEYKYTKGQPLDFIRNVPESEMNFVYGRDA
jgi:hypothetical protein